jgi:hypothetical protein
MATIAEVREFQSRYDSYIAALSRRLDALSRPGSRAIRPIGEFTLIPFTNVHTAINTTTITAYRIPDQYEFWAMYLIGGASSGDLTSDFTFIIRDDRTGRTTSGDAQKLRMDFGVGSSTTPMEFKPPRVFGQQITVETTKTTANAGDALFVLFGIMMNTGNVIARKNV